MDLLTAMKSRRSIRSFKPDLVPDKLVRELLEAARLSPSGSNLQPARYIVVKSKETRAKLSECTPLPFVAQAPIVIVCCADTQVFTTAGQRYKELQEAGAFSGTPLESTSDDAPKRRVMDEVTAKAYVRLNTAIAIDHITLRAVELGLGSCWIMMFDPDKVRKALAVDERYEIVALLPIGYPDQHPAQRPRLGVEELLLKEL